MRKVLIGLGLVGVMVVSGAAGAWAANSSHRQIEVDFSGIKLAVDGKQVDLAGVEPFLYNDRTYLPARFVAQPLGAKVEWDGAGNTVQVYSKSYVQVASEGGMKTWTMPGQGFSVKAPANFMQANLGLGALELLSYDFTSGDMSMVIVRKQSFEGDPAPLKEKAQSLLTGLGMLLMPDAKVTAVTESTGAVTLSGTATLQGKPAQFVLKLVAAGSDGAWAMMGLTTQSGGAAAVSQVIESFTAQ
jgi:hypothetical protein